LLSNAIAVAGMGVAGYLYTNRAIVVLTAVLGVPTLLALARILRRRPAFQPSRVSLPKRWLVAPVRGQIIRWQRADGASGPALATRYRNPKRVLPCQRARMAGRQVAGDTRLCG
jgi:hypothetical protein